MTTWEDGKGSRLCGPAAVGAPGAIFSDTTTVRTGICHVAVSLALPTLNIVVLCPLNPNHRLAFGMTRGSR